MYPRKIKKLLNKPHLFIRDYLIKKYPLTLNKNDIPANYNTFLIENELNEMDCFKPLFDIDVVFTWVDNEDTKWKAKFYNNKSIKTTISPFSQDSTRFTSHNEIFFSVFSVLKFLPWVNHIYIITDDQIPNLPKSNKITIIDHKEIIPSNYLPTFNSHVIEAYIHKIKNLTENFLYFNDDFFVARQLPKEHFFKSNGLASLFTAKPNSSFEMITATSQATTNVNLLFKKLFQVTFNRPLVHTYVPLKKSSYIKAHDLFKEEITEFSKNKFRSPNDLNMATFLVPYLQYIDQLSYTNLDICTYFNIRSPNAFTAYNLLLNQKLNHNTPHSFCANDFNDSKNNLDEALVFKNLNNFLSQFYEINLS